MVRVEMMSRVSMLLFSAWWSVTDWPLSHTTPPYCSARPACTSEYFPAVCGAHVVVPKIPSVIGGGGDGGGGGGGGWGRW